MGVKTGTLFVDGECMAEKTLSVGGLDSTITYVGFASANSDVLIDDVRHGSL